MDDRLVIHLRHLEKLINTTRSLRELNNFSHEQLELMQDIRQKASSAREQAEFFLAEEDKEARDKGFELAIQQLDSVNQGLLQASMHNLLDAVDVSQLSALARLCIDRIETLKTKEGNLYGFGNN